jgi:hypothetical protein
MHIYGIGSVEQRTDVRMYVDIFCDPCKATNYKRNIPVNAAPEDPPIFLYVDLHPRSSGSTSNLFQIQ